MIFDSAALSPGCGADARRTARTGEPSILSTQTWLEVDHELQKAMYVGIEQLGMLWRFRHDPRTVRSDPSGYHGGRAVDQFPD